tara:strand:+ start:646 stop:885 length:240 start_codon:yes stop_codon:yes gene_type:complete
LIFRIHIPKDSEQLHIAHKVRKILITSGIKTTTYEPEDAQIGIKVHEVLSEKLLAKIFGLIQRRGYDITINNQNKGKTI